jgi:F-type H+-transporting ATPase subunit delta
MYEYLDRRYALALYNVAEEKGKIEEYLKDFREIVQLIKSNEELQQIIKHPQISTSTRKKTFIKLFKGRIDEELLSFLLLLIEKDRILYAEEKLNEIEKIHLERNNTLIADVKTVVNLQNEEREELIKILQTKYNKKIILREEINKELIGGVYVRVGNDVIDGTIKSKIDEMKEMMLSRK